MELQGNMVVLLAVIPYDKVPSLYYKACRQLRVLKGATSRDFANFWSKLF